MKKPNKIRLYRVTCGMTQKEMAEDLGISSFTLGRMERGIVSPKMALRLKEYSKGEIVLTIEDLVKCS